MTTTNILRHALFGLALVLTLGSAAQSTLRGTVVDDATNEPIPGAVVRIDGRTTTGMTDSEGKFRIENQATGLVNVRIEAIGYQAYTAFEVLLTRAKAVELEVRLRSLGVELEAKKVEKTLLMRTTATSRSDLSRERTRMDELRGADVTPAEANTSAEGERGL